MALTKEQIIQELKDVKDHGCYEEGDEYGIRKCCFTPDYLPHKDKCTRAQAIDKAIALVEKESQSALSKELLHTIIDAEIEEAHHSEKHDTVLIRQHTWKKIVKLAEQLKD